MTWYAVHLLMIAEFKDGNQSNIPAWDNVCLIEAKDGDEATKDATEIGRSSEGDSEGTFYWDDRPATLICKGVRKVIEVSNPSSVNNDPGDGAETTYQTLIFDDTSTVDHFLSGSPTKVLIID